MIVKQSPATFEGTQGVQRNLVAQGLVVKEMPLKSLPNGNHWHVSKPGERGVLELTWSEGILVFEVRANRQGAWIENAIAALA